MKQKILALAAALAVAATGVWAEGAPSDTAQKKPAPPVKLETRSYQLKIVKTKEGKLVKKWVPAGKVVPGEVVRYVTTVENRGEMPMEKVRIVNPIDPHLSYVARSAKCAGTCTIRFSVDGGRHFDTPERLVVMDKKGKKRQARPVDYNAIEWVLDRIDAKKESSVEFKAKLK